MLTCLPLDEWPEASRDRLGRQMQFDKNGRPFRRRNYLPGGRLIAAVAVVSLMRLAGSGPTTA
jgi:hypothetical protein